MNTSISVYSSNMHPQVALRAFQTITNLKGIKKQYRKLRLKLSASTIFQTSASTAGSSYSVENVSSTWKGFDTDNILMSIFKYYSEFKNMVSHNHSSVNENKQSRCKILRAEVNLTIGPNKYKYNFEICCK